MQHTNVTIAPVTGYFGSPTSSINWCEPDYLHSPYIAETFNTISNLFYNIFALIAWSQLAKFYRKNTQLTRLQRLYVAPMSLFIVGLGSWCFHMTLTVQNQMFDEISMHLPVLCLLYMLFNFREYAHASGDKKKPFLGFSSFRHFVTAMISVGVLILLLLAYDVHNPALFQSVYFVELITCFAVSLYYSHHRQHDGISAQRHSKTQTKLMWLVFASMITGFGLWNIDQHFCNSFVESLKLHSMWHFFTAYGAYLWQTWTIYTYYATQHDWLVANKKEPNSNGFQITWKYLILPYVEEITNLK
jgi:dihydroceramidase